MTDIAALHEGVRVRILYGSVTTQPGNEATITKVLCNGDGSIKASVVLVQGAPAKIHGTTVLPHEIELVTAAYES